jgi:tetratricopeptide (TPR) repeat protein/tRNA A-37 threonylcarbamoyl transferase component Bud32
VSERTDPELIGPYQVIRRLGAGGMGEVFLAHDPRLDRPVAIKRIRGAGDPVRRARFLREARLAAGLSHPAIVQVFDLVSEGGDDHIVMEHVAGTTLRERLQEEGPLRPAQGLPLAAAVAEGLAEAHRHGIVHRDLKSENVLLTAGGQPRIADFGIARRPAGSTEHDTLTDAGAVLGTYRSMSPEQARGEPTDARSDLFAFGVLLYEMFTGQSPFLADNGLATLQRVLHHRPPTASEINPEIPGELSELIDHLLEKQPLLRPRDAGEVAQRLRAMASGLGDGEATWLPGTTPGPPPAPRKRMETKALRPILAAILLLGLALAVLLALRLRPAAPPEELPPPPPLYVAVLAPHLQGPAGEDGDFLAFAVRGALQSGLTSFEGVFPKGTGEVDAVAGRPAEVARAVAADEVLEPTLACQGGSCKVAVSRLRGADGAATWSGSVEIPRAEPLTAARALAVLLRQAYPERRLRSGVPALRATPADYSEYLAVLRAVSGEKRGADGPELLARLAEIRRRSPEFVEAYRLAATIEINGFKSVSRDPAGIDRALRLLAQARDLAPGDPDVRYASAWAELLAERLDEGEAALAAFETAAPGDVRVLDLRSMLAERRGRPAEALAVSRAAVERQPSWPRLYEHAKLARRQGETAEARRSLNLLLSRFPGNPWGRQLLAVLELTNGDPERAAALYEEMTAQSSDPGLLVNLGLARMLLGNYPAAAAAMEKAVKAEPKNDFYLLNLAQARWLEGRKAEGEALCRRVLAISPISDPAAGQEWQRLTVRAQALAQLGAREDAVAAAQEALALAPRSGQAAFEASLVYTLAGDRTAALVNARRAVRLGFDAPAWFRLPWFEPLRTDPGFRRLMSAR